jgi:hypothetical protein
MKTFGLALLAAVVGYAVGTFASMALIERFSSNQYDRSVEAAMTSALVVGPLIGLLSAGLVVAYRTARSHVLAARAAARDREPSPIARRPPPVASWARDRGRFGRPWSTAGAPATSTGHAIEGASGDPGAPRCSSDWHCLRQRAPVYTTRQILPFWLSEM